MEVASITHLQHIRCYFYGVYIFMGNLLFFLFRTQDWKVLSVKIDKYFLPGFLVVFWSQIHFLEMGLKLHLKPITQIYNFQYMVALLP